MFPVDFKEKVFWKILRKRRADFEEIVMRSRKTFWKLKNHEEILRRRDWRVNLYELRRLKKILKIRKTLKKFVRNFEKTYKIFSKI